MKKTGLIITLVVVAIMVGAITIKLATQEERGTARNQTYQENGEAGKLTDGMLGITSSNYDELVKNYKGVVVVDFFSPTCGYCIKYTPEFSAAYLELKDKAKFGKYDVSADIAKVSYLSIKSTPTTIVFKDGEEVKRIGGYTTKEKLIEEVNKFLPQK